MAGDHSMPMVLVSALLLMALAGCSKTQFVPDITLPQARPIIDATAEFHEIYPAPALISGKESFGLTGPEVSHVPPTVLAKEVRDELMTAFDEAGMFSKITTFDREPDFILTGRINSLYEHYRPRIWTRLPLPYAGKIAADLFNLKSHATNGEADITLFLLTRDGKVVGTYRGSSSFEEHFNPTGEMGPGDRLNRALTDAVQQIQEKMLHDAHLRTIAAG
ncbi:MAG TPA: hypothetical protein VJR03_11380 [Nitrospira sp.]|nr:hypothetical protein [Nitrospira sp.]